MTKAPTKAHAVSMGDRRRAGKIEGALHMGAPQKFAPMALEN